MTKQTKHCRLRVFDFWSKTIQSVDMFLGMCENTVAQNQVANAKIALTWELIYVNPPFSDTHSCWKFYSENVFVTKKVPEPI